MRQGWPSTDVSWSWVADYQASSLLGSSSLSLSEVWAPFANTYLLLLHRPFLDFPPFPVPFSHSPPALPILYGEPLAHKSLSVAPVTVTAPFNPILCLLTKYQTDPGIRFVPQVWKQTAKDLEGATGGIPEARIVISPTYRKARVFRLLQLAVGIDRIFCATGYSKELDGFHNTILFSMSLKSGLCFQLAYYLRTAMMADILKPSPSTV